tara:strand:- start:202 stop:651 length:450 start_codon:yes stop_codon:yes gene_type:complete
MTTLKWEETIPISLKESWRFFSNPKNLSKLMPSHMDFQIISDAPEEVYEGMVLNYSVRPLMGIKMYWSTEITQVKEESYFVDNQISGPYKIWHHQHHFEECEGGVKMTDILNYELPYSIFNTIINNLIVKNEIQKIFTYRKESLKTLLK